MYLACFPSTGHETAPPSLPRVLRDSSLVLRYYEILRLPALRPAVLGFLRSAVPPLDLVRPPLPRTEAAVDLGLFAGSPSGISVETTGSPKFPGNL